MSFFVIHNLIGGIDTDSHDSEISPSDYRDALNIRNSISDSGAGKIVSNLKGTAEVEFDLGSGRHKTIGSYEETQETTIIYFVWSENGEHKILRYFPNKTSAANPYGVIELVIMYDFKWEEQTKITSIDLVDGKLLYWTDPKPRKINIIKANVTNKLKTWKIIFPKGFTSTHSCDFTIINRTTGATVASALNYSIAANTSHSDVLSDLVALFEATGRFVSRLSFEYCTDCSINVSQILIADHLLVTDSSLFQIIPDNWYGDSILAAGNNLNDRLFDRIKYPPTADPVVTMLKDSKKNYNRLKGKSFQFRLQYHYDDSEQSALSPISLIARNKTLSSANYIKVNFNQSDLFSNINLAILTKISVLARDGNDSPWKEVEKNDICEFYYYEGGQKVFKWDFYNDTASFPISDILAVKQYDKVPLFVGGSIVANSRIIDGNPTDDYDINQCIDLTPSITYKAVTPQQTYKVRGNIRIFSYRMDDDDHTGTIIAGTQYYFKKGQNYSEPHPLELNGFIFSDTSLAADVTGGKFPHFGGGGFGYGGGGDFGITAGMRTDYKQTIPEGGWAVYSAGSPYLSISKQDYIGLPVDSKGALDISTSTHIDNIGLASYNVLNKGNSKFELDLPNGRHIIRLASHYCSFGDKLGYGDCYDLNKGLYQKTSTNVWGVYDTLGNWVGGQYEIEVVVNGADIDIGTFVVKDQAPVWDELSVNNGVYTNYCGYVYDDNGAVNANDPNFSGVPVNRAFVYMYGDKVVTYLEQYTQGRIITDHNGYFYYDSYSAYNLDPDQTMCFVNVFGVGATTGTYINVADLDTLPAGWVVNTKLTLLKGIGTLMFEGTLSKLYTKSLSPFGSKILSGVADPASFIEAQKTYDIIIITDNTDARNRCSTKITGKLTNELAGVSVIDSRGNVTHTNDKGEYELITWGEMGNNIFVSPYWHFEHYNNRVGNVIFNNTSENDIAIPTSTIAYTIAVFGLNALVQINTSPYSPTSIAQLADLTATGSLLDFENARKRGGRYQLSLRYYDAPNRSTPCLAEQSTEIYIPHITEDLHLYDDTIALGTYNTGIANINFAIAGAPPIHATHYQIMITSDLVRASYLQFRVNAVKFVIKRLDGLSPEITTPTPSAETTLIKLNLNNINDYYRKHSDSQIAYSFTPGDRITFLADRDNYLQSYIDVEVVGWESPNSIFIKYNGFVPKSGYLVEIYTPKIHLSDRIFYECGNFYPCTNPNDPSNAHSVTSGVLKGNDTYWRNRLIEVNDGIYFAAKLTYVEANDISDFYPSKYADIGRVGIKDLLYKRIQRISTLRVSNNYIPNSNINGLSEVENVDDIDLGVKYGKIIKFIEIGDTILSIHENHVVAIYKGSVMVKSKTGALLATSSEAITDSRSLLGDFGCQNPESVYKKDNEVYGYDGYRGIEWKYDNNGFNITSNYKVKSLFDNFGPIWDAPSIYDSKFDEYITSLSKAVIKQVLLSSATIGAGTITLVYSTSYGLSLGKFVLIKYRDVQVYGYVTTYDSLGGTIVITLVEDLRVDANFSIIYKGEVTTISYSAYKKRWNTRYSFVPEYYGAFRKEIVSFVDGKLFVHDVNSTRNAFHNLTPAKSSISFVVNNISARIADKIEMVYRAITIYSRQTSGVNNWSIPIISNYKQLSRLIKSKFLRREAWWHSQIDRDINSTGGLLNGNAMRGDVMKFELENDATEEFILEQIKILGDTSPKS